MTLCSIIITIQALIEERKLYCFVVEHFCSVIHNQIAYNALVSHYVLCNSTSVYVFNHNIIYSNTVVTHYGSIDLTSITLQSHQVLSTKVTDWSTQCSSPNELPSESAILLVVCQ